MKELMLNNQNEVNTIDSREVAEMMGRSHSDVMKMIQGSGKNLGIIPVLEKGNILVADYFIESTYKVDGNNKSYNCYLLTKKGCELLGSKLQGEKGILFKSRFLAKFNNLDIKASIKDITKDFEYIKRKEICFIELLSDSLKAYNIEGFSQYRVLNYKIDYYIPLLNIAIEYDENDHRHYIYEQQEGRQKEIEKELGCRFIRISDKNSDGYNIGYVIKEMFDIKL